MAHVNTHAFERIGRDLERGEIGRIVFLHGPEQYLVSWAVDHLIQTFVQEATAALDLVRMDPDVFDVDDLIEACETIPMLSERKVVVLEHFSLLWKPGRSLAFREDNQQRFLEYLPKVPEQTLLIVAAPEAEDYRTRQYGNALSKALAKEGQEYRFEPLAGAQLLGFIKKRLVAGEKTASKQTMEMLIAESGYSNKEIDYGLFHLDSDLHKIIALSEGSEITEEDVLQGISDNLEHNAFLFLDSISSGKKGEAFSQVSQLLRSGVNEFQLLARIVGHLELMLEVKEMREAGASVPQIIKVLGAKKYPVKKAMNFGSRYSVDQLRRMLQSAFDVEKNIKSGLLSGQMALEMFIAGIY